MVSPHVDDETRPGSNPESLLLPRARPTKSTRQRLLATFHPLRRRLPANAIPWIRASGSGGKPHFLTARRSVTSVAPEEEDGTEEGGGGRP